VFAFLTAAGTEWDAPLVGAPLTDPPLPLATEIDLRDVDIDAPPLDAPASSEGIGSNNFALAGDASTHGGAILANDMHLGLRVPSLWFRVELHYADGDGQPWVATGVTVPGTPVLIAGSNRRIAWGFTNSYGDWSDFVELRLDAGNPERYASADGWQTIVQHDEVIAVRGAEPDRLTVRETVFGPIAAQSSGGAPLALSWTAHHAQGVNAGLARLEQASDVDDAVRIAHVTGMPAQNLLLADSAGRVAWTLIGPIPRRPAGIDARFPIDRSEANTAWDGWLADSEVPRMVDPPGNRLWTANARTMSDAQAALIGDGGYTIGARARQIRDGLQARERLSESDLLAIQLDARALFLARWQQLLTDLLGERSDPQSAALRAALGDWNGRASADTRAYRLVRDFRLRVHARFLQLFEAPLRAADPDWKWPSLPQLEGAVWLTLTQRPVHLLPKNFADWDAWLLAAAHDVLANLAANDIAIEQATWGALNTTAIRHPLSGAIPVLGRLLDMPAEALDGDQYMPRVQGPSFGASQRMVVSPGREATGTFHMPGGQSGHPLSPFYGSGHDDWARGRPSPFLPGPAKHRLVLKPL
jgi:penicillin amidase